VIPLANVEFRGSKAMNAGQIPVAVKPRASLGRIIWRVIYWGSIVVGAWGIVLMLRRAPAPQVTVSPEAARSAEQKLATLAAPSAPSLTPSEPQRIALSEEELNSFLAARLRFAEGGAGTEPSLEQVKASVRDVKVTFVGDRARAFVLFNLAGKDLTLQLEGRLHVVDGYLRFEPTGGSLGDLSVPGSVLDAAISRLFTSPENRENFRLPPDIRDIRIENGELVIERQ
jgi:hypothetical protein